MTSQNIPYPCYYDGSVPISGQPNDALNENVEMAQNEDTLAHQEWRQYISASPFG